MGLNIKNPAVEDRIRELAVKRGVSLTEAVNQAVSESLARERDNREQEIARRIAKIDAIVAHAAALPVLDPRSWQVIRDELNEESLA